METKFQKRLKHLFTISFLFISFIAVSMVVSKGTIDGKERDKETISSSKQSMKYRLHFFKPI